MWTNQFSKKILDRGLNYYLKGNVEIAEEAPEYVYCTVDSDTPGVYYDVDIAFYEDYAGRNKVSMECDCPYAMDGNTCKHMAAAMYCIESDSLFERPFFNQQNHSAPIKKASSLVKKYVPILEEKTEEKYNYFDLYKITENMQVEEKALSEIKDMIEHGRLTLKSVETFFSNSYMRRGEQQCKVTGEYHDKNGYLYDLDFTMSDKEIIKANCIVPGCYCHVDKTFYYYYDSAAAKFCNHIFGLIRLANEFEKNHTVGDDTDINGMEILDLYRNKQAGERAKAREISNLTDAVDIEPRIVAQDGELHLTFKIGREKKYVMKSIKDFYHKYTSGETLTLGKNNQINLNTAIFTERGEIYKEYILREVKQELERKERLESKSRSWYTPEVKAEGMGGYLDLFGTRLDDLYDKLSGTQVLFADKYNGIKEHYISLKEASLKIKLAMSPNMYRNDLQSINVTGYFPDLYEGSKYKYFVENDYLCRLDDSTNRQLGPLSNLSEDGTIDLKIGRTHIAEFYYNILPQLEQIAEIKNLVGDKVEPFLPKDVSIRFYLDAEAGNLICRPVAKYEDEEFSIIDAADPYQVTPDYRDKMREREAYEIVSDYFPTVSRESADNNLIMICEDSEENAYEILNEGISQLMGVGEVHCTDRFKSKNVKKKIKLSVGISVESDIMNLEVISEDISPKELLDILESYNLKKKYHRLKSGEFVDITEESIAELATMMDAMRISPKEFTTGKMQLPLYRALYLDKMLESCSEIYSTRDSVFRNLVKGFKTIDDSDYELRKDLDKTLRNYQKYGYKWIRALCDNNFGGILADDMGLGKTLQMISVIADTKDGTSLVVCPASLVYNWQEEFKQFAPDIKTRAVVGSADERKVIIDDFSQYDVLVTSYDLLKRDIAEYGGKTFQYQVIDEAQYIKTHTTAAAKSVKLVKAKHKLALTGTPIENRLSELWSIFDYLMPGFLYSYDVFKKEIETPIVKQKDEDATKRLKRMVSPFILRRLKGDVLKDLPEKLEELQYAHMDNEQRTLYDAQVTHMLDVVKGQDDESFKKSKIQILAELTRIRQICCDPNLMVDNYRGQSAKKDACLDLIDRAIEGNHKMLVFSQFTTMLDILAKELEAKGINYYMITGATAKEKRLELVKNFNGDDTPVFLISLKAGGTGLNLTGADIVIHYDPWWNVAAQNQATDRAHRIGQTKIVTVYKLIVKDSIEEKIVKMQQSKADLADAILGGENGNLVNMTRDDLLELLEI